MKRDATKITKATTALRSKADAQLCSEATVSGASQTDLETIRLLHELQVHHLELEMQNTELRLTRDTAESDRDKMELLLTQSKITEQVLNENKILLDKLSKTLERRVCEGITELRKKDKLLLSQNRQAAMGEMINCIAHQWRQPLNMIGLNVQQLKLYYDLDPLDRKLLNKIVNNTMQTINYMSKTIDDFRNFFKPDKELDLFEVNKAINSVVSLARDSLKHFNIKLDIVTQGDLHINGYPNEYAQVVLNIIMNAQDALLEHKVNQPRITISSFMDNDRSVVTITDNAGGIPEQNLGLIFEPYFTTKGPAKGTGIGLFMAKTIIEKNMHGRLTVCNNNGGAEFRIEV